MIDTCENVKKCADELMCVCRDKKDSCSYARHLANGLNFHEDRFAKGPYLLHGERLYYIGKTTKNGSFRLDTDAQVVVREAGLELVPFILDHTVVEKGTEEEPCDSRVILKIGGTDHTLLNANVRMLQHASAISLLESLSEMGHMVRLERVAQARTGNARPTMKQAPTPKEATPLLVQSNLETLEKTVEKPAATPQVNLFDLF